MDAIILTPGEGREIMLGPVRITVQEDGAHTRGTFGLAEFAFTPLSFDTKSALGPIW